MIFALPILSAALLLTNSTDIAAALRNGEIGRPFDLTGRLVYTHLVVRYRALTIEDANGITALSASSETPEIYFCEAGDTLHVEGRIFRSDNGALFPVVLKMEVLSHGARPLPIDATPKDIRSGICDARLTRITGKIRDVSRDDVDPNWIFITVVCDGECLYATLRTEKPSDEAIFRSIKKLTDSEVSLTGRCSQGDRRNMFTRVLPMDRSLLILSPEAIQVKKAPLDDPFAIDTIDSIRGLPPEEIVIQGRKHTSGTVIAAWNNGSVLIQEPSNSIIKARISDAPFPHYGDSIEIAGMPETDLYNINLADAIWRPAKGSCAADADPEPITAKQLLTDGMGHTKINARRHGTTIRLRGLIQDLPAPTHPGLIAIRDGEFTIPVDISSCPSAAKGLALGCTAEIAGVCVVESDTWRPYAPFPRLSGIVLVPRGPGDVRIVAHPPWWTPGRLMAVIGILLAALVGILIWNRVLRHIIDKRSRQLFKEQIARTSSELRVEERTRLAAELHDAMSQNISSAALQIDAAERLSGIDHDKEIHHLEIASKTLQSCREEMRNCIWDLRNASFDEPDLAKAITRMLNVHVGSANLSVRFNVPRSRLSDNTVHAILKTIRELATNAVRHGKAKSIRIAGALDGSILNFSVTDDGCGFDPDDRPGIADGHFGLQGIEERIRQFNGRMDIESGPNSGTRVRITLNAAGTTEKGIGRNG